MGDHTHTRIRTGYGSYTVEELKTSTPRQLSRTASAQVRDYINNRDRPTKLCTLADLRPTNPRLRHTWQEQPSAMEHPAPPGLDTDPANTEILYHRPAGNHDSPRSSRASARLHDKQIDSNRHTGRVG